MRASKLHLGKIAARALLFLVPSVLAAAQGVPIRHHNPIVPLGPAELIKFLPTAPSGWTLVQSNAKDFFVGWICSQATREFHLSSAVPALGANKAPPQTTVIRLMDTGYFPSFNGDFENFRIGKYGAAETLIVDGLPARKFVIGRNHERLRVSVRGRFIVEVETENQPPNSVQSWLRVIDVPRVSAIPDSSAAILPKPLCTTKIDELNPGNNSSSVLFWSGEITGETNR